MASSNGNDSDSSNLSYIQYGTEDPLRRAMEYLITYSQRNLSYDTDALNAIEGALRSLTLESVYHTWGVPFIYPEIALIWHREKPARRRVGMPTWSPLGWEGEVAWTGPVMLGEFPATREFHDIELHLADGSYLSLFEYVKNQPSTGVLPYLRLRHFTAGLRVKRKHGRYYIVIPLTNTINMGYSVRLDISPSTSVDWTLVKGMILPTLEPAPTGTEHPHECVMLIRPSNTHYEHIGVAWIPSHTSGADDLEYMAKGYSDRQQWEEHSLDDPIWRDIMLFDADLAWMAWNAWSKVLSDADLSSRVIAWQDGFAEESIILG
ncbi:hypothetical protein E8E11_006076 [Didymella keratinophila]|nr:hypothetical protein E8E11_006076 [Didymella keratinophila]